MTSQQLVATLSLSSEAEGFSELVSHALANCVGTNGRQEPQPFVPRADLVKFWIPDRINQVLKTCQPRPWFKAATIAQRYLQIFSLLVYANRLHALVRLVSFEIDDLCLRRDNVEDLLCKHLPGPLNKTARKAILKHQWQFCPVDIGAQQLTHVNLAEKRILPFELGEILCKNGSATVRKVFFWQSCKSPKEPYVLKTYTLQEKASYDQEHAACTLMLSKQSRNLIEYHGCFIQNNTYNLLLQFVGGGDLLRYFAETPKPETEDDINLFWRSLRSIWRGVHQLHQGHAEHNSQTIDKVQVTPLQMPNNRDFPAVFVSYSADRHLPAHSVHQDLKPDNILVSKGKSESKYDFIPILTDFGHSCFQSVARQNLDPNVPDQHGNQEFAAPEASHHAKYLRSGPSTVTSKADIWAMGCIFSVAAVWVVMGPEGIQEYAQLRGQEIARSPNFENKTACFHNGVCLLDAVKTMHNKVSHFGKHEGAAPNGGLLVTAEILKVLEIHCLAEKPTDRKPARAIHESLCLLDQAQEPAPLDRETRNATSVTITPRSIASSSKAASIRQRSVDSLRVPSSSGRESRLRRAASTAPAVQKTNNTLTLDQCHKWMAAKRSNQPIPDAQVDHSIRCIQNNLRGREYVFLIDDSRSMAKYKNDMKEAFDVLSYISKPMDPNRVELIYASKPSDVHRLNRGFRSTLPGLWSKVMKTFDNCKFEHLTGHLEDHLNKVIKSIIQKESLIRRERLPTSLFIFTDGNWGVDPQHTTCGVERCVQRLMTFSRDYGDRTFIMVQFIRFGDDAQGIRHLKYLDTFGSDKDWDIVDHKAITDDVQAIFAGSINQQSDHDGEESVHEYTAHHHRRHSGSRLP